MGTTPKQVQEIDSKFVSSYFQRAGFSPQDANTMAHMWTFALTDANRIDPSKDPIDRLYGIGATFGRLNYILKQAKLRRSGDDTDLLSNAVQMLQGELIEQKESLTDKISKDLRTKSPVAKLSRVIERLAGQTPHYSTQLLNRLGEASSDGALSFLGDAAKATAASLGHDQALAKASEDPEGKLAAIRRDLEIIRKYQAQNPDKFNCGWQLIGLRMGGC
jgi:hypothetical protein